MILVKKRPDSGKARTISLRDGAALLEAIERVSRWKNGGEVELTARMHWGKRSEVVPLKCKMNTRNGMKIITVSYPPFPLRREKSNKSGLGILPIPLQF